MHDETRLSAGSSRLYLPFLDGLRGLAALYVVLFHCWIQTWPIYLHPDSHPKGLTALLTDWLGYGHFSVTVFIAISGFSLALPVVRGGNYLRGGVKRFFERRAVRILPPYFAALAISYFIAGVLLRQHLTTFGFFAHLLLIHDLFPIQFESNGPLWSVALECQIYLFFPLLVLLRRRAGMASVLAFTFLVGFGAFWGTQMIGWYTNFYYYLLIFAIGMFAAHTCFTDRAEASKRRILSILTATLLAVAGSIVVHWRAPSVRKTQLSVAVISLLLLYLCAVLSPKVRALYVLGGFASAAALALLIKGGQSADIVPVDMLVGIASACFIVVCTLRPAFAVNRLLSSPRLEALGAFSYSLYLVHLPLQELLFQWLAPFHLRAVVKFSLVATLGTAALIGTAYLFFMAFERPFLRRTKVGSMRAATA